MFAPMSGIIDEQPEADEIAHLDRAEETVERLYRGGAGNPFYYYDHRLRGSNVRIGTLIIIDRDEASRVTKELGYSDTDINERVP
jgi:hypothetical protein